MMTIDESFLDAWLRLSATMHNVSIRGELTRNERMVCHALYARQQQEPGSTMTPTELSRATLIRRSQINRNLNQLEAGGIATRERASDDRRQVNVRLNLDHADAFLQEREQELAIVHLVVESLGEERATEALELMHDIVALAEERFPLAEE